MMLPPSKPPLHPQAINPTAVEVVDISGDGDIAKVRNFRYFPSLVFPSDNIFDVFVFKFEYAQHNYSLFSRIHLYAQHPYRVTIPVFLQQLVKIRPTNFFQDEEICLVHLEMPMRLKK